MAQYEISGANAGTALMRMLEADDIAPGSAPSYQLCKDIYAYHPFGGKLVDVPINIAQSQAREISIDNDPGDRAREAFLREWVALEADRYIGQGMRLARIYGISTIALMVNKAEPKVPVDFAALGDANITFNIFDPLNTSGSLTFSQVPLSPAFMKAATVAVNGVAFHPSRTVVMVNEDPLYIEWTTSAFGFVGRSVYQRALFPLKSFVQTMLTDDFVSRKAGILVAKLEQPGSIIDNVMATIGAVKRAAIKMARTNNVISIAKDEAIESLNLQNIDGAVAMARKNIIDNIAAAADGMPAKLLNSETFAEGFGEGTEDAKHVAQYIDRIRLQMKPLYDFFDQIAMYRAWTPKFYETIKNDFPEAYGDVSYEEAFYGWRNSFKAVWPSLLTEPDSEKVKVDDVKLRAAIAIAEVMLPGLDGDNRGRLFAWLADTFNGLELLAPAPLELDWDSVASAQEQLGEYSEPPPPRPEGLPRGDGLVEFRAAVGAITSRANAPERRSLLRHLGNRA